MCRNIYIVIHTYNSFTLSYFVYADLYKINIHMIQVFQTKTLADMNYFCLDVFTRCFTLFYDQSNTIVLV